MRRSVCWGRATWWGSEHAGIGEGRGGEGLGSARGGEGCACEHACLRVVVHEEVMCATGIGGWHVTVTITQLAVQHMTAQRHVHVPDCRPAAQCRDTVTCVGAQCTDSFIKLDKDFGPGEYLQSILYLQQFGLQLRASLLLPNGVTTQRKRLQLTCQGGFICKGREGGRERGREGGR